MNIIFDNGTHKVESAGTLKTTPSAIRHITVGAFRLRFTLSEKVAIETSADPVVKVLQADMSASKYIDLDNTALLQGLDYYVTAGILAGQPRIDELTTNGTQEEAY
jgi:hypothetical protein